MVKKKTRSGRKHIPQRTCVACRTVHAKFELIRVVNLTDGTVVIDENGKRNGRGAYLCRKQACWDQALKTGSLSRALGIALKPEDVDVIRAYADTLPDLVE
ncbi:MAG: YlxR family protein [Anaerolineales bacterium]|nr:MAG: YlxR family protein [Anaerolineales bacterium]